MHSLHISTQNPFNTFYSKPIFYKIIARAVPPCFTDTHQEKVSTATHYVADGLMRRLGGVRAREDGSQKVGEFLTPREKRTETIPSRASCQLLVSWLVA